MRAISRGYLTLGPGDVRLDPWSVSLAGAAALSSPDHLNDWSYYQSLKVRTTLVAELASLIQRLQLDEAAKLGLVILWVSPGTSLRGASTIFPLEMMETSAELEIAGGLLRGDLKLECQIILIRPSVASTSVAPTECQRSSKTRPVTLFEN
jgi:hypothetical protein